MEALQFFTKEESKLITFGYIRRIQFLINATIPYALFNLVWLFYYKLWIFVGKYGDLNLAIKLNKKLLIKHLIKLRNLWKIKNIEPFSNNPHLFRLKKELQFEFPYTFISDIISGAEVSDVEESVAIQFRIYFSLQFESDNNDKCNGEQFMVFKINYNYAPSIYSNDIHDIDTPFRLALTWNPIQIISHISNDKQYEDGHVTNFNVELHKTASRHDIYSLNKNDICIDEFIKYIQKNRGHCCDEIFLLIDLMSNLR